jgi:hypothetical protein
MLQTLRPYLGRSKAAVSISLSSSRRIPLVPNNIRPMFTRVNTLSLIHLEGAKRREGVPKVLRLRAITSEPSPCAFHQRLFAIHVIAARKWEFPIPHARPKEVAAILPWRGHKANSIFTTTSPCKQNWSTPNEYFVNTATHVVNDMQLSWFHGSVCSTIRALAGPSSSTLH